MKKTKILVIRFKQIGDAILSSVICKNLKEKYPDSQIDYVLYDYVAPLFENQEYIDNVISINLKERKNPFKYLKKVWEVTREDYDIVIDIMSTPKSEFFTLFSRKAKFKIGRYKKNRGYTYTHSIKEPVGNYDKSEKFLELLSPLNLDKNTFNKTYTLDFSNREKENIKNKMISCGVNFNKIIIPIAINSRREHKVYPIDLMKELVYRLLNKYNCEIILFYSKEEKEFAINFHKELNFHPRIFSNIETKSIRELGAMFSQCDIFIGNEGGPRHLAQGVDLPSFAIFSPGSSKNDWMLKDSKKHFAIEPIDINIKNYDLLTYEEKYKLITPNIIMENIQENLITFINKKNIYSYESLLEFDDIQEIIIRKSTEYYIKSRLNQENLEDISPAFQSKNLIKNKKIIGAETLARWYSEKFGIIPPDIFIPIAESLNLIHLIDYKIAEESIKFLKELKNEKLIDFTFKISFNFSIKTLEQEDVIEYVSKLLKKYSISGKYIEIEITETILSCNFQKILKKLEELKKLEISIALDDFPKGHSTLSLLNKFPIDIVKFDKSILDEITKSNSNFNEKYINLINLVKNLNLNIIAEGIEKEYQLKFLDTHSIKIGQGYLFSKPVSSINFKDILLDKEI